MAVAVAVAVGVEVGVRVAVGVGVGVKVAVAVGVALGLAVGVGVGVPDEQQTKPAVTVTLSTLQPVRDIELSEHMRQRSFTCWPMPAAGKLTVVVVKPPETPLQFGRLGKHGFMKLPLIPVWS